MKKGKQIGPVVFAGTMTPKESAEHFVKLNLQMILDCIKQGKKFKRSALEHNLQTIVNTMEKADLLKDE